MEFTVLVPFFVLLLVLFTDASMIYLTHTEMYNCARASARRMATGQLKTAEDVRSYSSEILHLGTRTYVIDTRFGNTMTVSIGIAMNEAVIVGLFFERVMGNVLTASATVRREPRLATG
jgi:hypothetical protein